MADNNNVEISKEGVKVSYLRLLSDSVSGFIVLLFVISSYYLPVFGKPLQEIYGVSFSTEAKIFIFVSFTLSASPIGLSINAMSWFSLGWLDRFIQIKLWKYRNKFFLRTAFFPDFDDLNNDSGIEKGEDWYRRTNLIKQTIEIYKSEIMSNFAYLRGMSILFRNVSFLLLIYPIIWFFIVFSLNIQILNSYNFSFSKIIILLFFVFISFLLSSLVAIHHDSRIYSLIYVLYFSNSKIPEKEDKKFVKSLAELLTKEKNESA